MTTSILKKIDVLKARIDSHRPLDAHILKQIREYLRIGKGISEVAGGLRIVTYVELTNE
jgi:hypothetical protein